MMNNCLFKDCTKKAVSIKDLGSGMCFEHLIKARANNWNMIPQDSNSRVYLLEDFQLILSKILVPTQYVEDESINIKELANSFDICNPQTKETVEEDE